MTKLVFESALVVRNKGCAATSGTTVVEEQTGWVPANPAKSGSVTLVSTDTNLEDNILTWSLGSIGINEYAVLTYQVKSSATYPENTNLRWNMSWDGRNDSDQQVASGIYLVMLRIEGRIFTRKALLLR